MMLSFFLVAGLANFPSAQSPVNQKVIHTLVTERQQLATAAREDPNLTGNGEWLRKNELVEFSYGDPERPLYGVCDRHLIEFPSIGNMTALNRAIQRGESMVARFSELNPSDRAQVLRLIKLSPFASKFKNAKDSGDFLIEIRPGLDAQIMQNGKATYLTAATGLPDTTEREDISIPSEKELFRKGNEEPLLGLT